MKGTALTIDSAFLKMVSYENIRNFSKNIIYAIHQNGKHGLAWLQAISTKTKTSFQYELFFTLKMETGVIFTKGDLQIVELLKVSTQIKEIRAVKEI